MLRSVDRVLTTHCGSLPRPDPLLAVLDARDAAAPGDAQARDRAISAAVGDVVARQAAVGLDVVNDGEHGKTSFSSYVTSRLGGLVPTDAPYGFQGPTRDRLQFPEVYTE